MFLVISDANILIDIEDGNLTSVIFRLPYEIAVPDILFELELKEQHGYLLEAGLKVIGNRCQAWKSASCFVQLANLQA